MPLTIEAVLFDYGLVLTGPPDPAAWARMREVTQLDEPAFHSAYWAPRHDYDRGAHTGAEYFRAAGLHAGLTLDPGQIAALLEADTQLWTQPNQPMIDFAARLQRAGTRTGILSNLGDEMTAGALARLPWLAQFDHCVWSHALGLAKPDPTIYAAAISGLRTAPDKILFIDDREDNLAGAKAAGLQTIRYLAHDAFVAEMQARGLGPLWTTGRVTLPNPESAL